MQAPAESWSWADAAPQYILRGYDVSQDRITGVPRGANHPERLRESLAYKGQATFPTDLAQQRACLIDELGRVAPSATMPARGELNGVFTR
jgi:hypothetical protein